jgi:hypothetical protein
MLAGKVSKIMKLGEMSHFVIMPKRNLENCRVAMQMLQKK